MRIQGRTLALLFAAVGLLPACAPSQAAAPTASPPTPSASPSPSPSPSAAPETTPTTAAVACAPDPMAHVYNPQRLHVLNPCVTVVGTIELVRAEADGDYHVRLSLDPGQSCFGQDCLNSANLADQHGDLVVEPVCEHTVTQTDALSACAGYHNPLVVPARGTHVAVTGPWVLDLDHGWNEVHPAEAFGPPPG